MKRMIWLALAAGIPACSEGDLNSEDPPGGDEARIHVDRTTIDFGVLEAGEESSAVITIESVGSETLYIYGLDPPEDMAFRVASDGMQDTLVPGDSAWFTVYYVASGGVDMGTVSVHSSDPIDPVVPVELVGGLRGAELAWDRDPLDFGVLSVGEAATETVTITNAGEAELTVDALVLDGDAFSAKLPATPFSLAGGEAVSLAVTFAPASSGVETGTITAASNAYQDNVLDITGTGTSKPIAVCGVDPETVTGHGQTANWIGEGSYDPDGAGIADYQWSLYSQPEGSAATMPGEGADRGPFEWDLAGEYVGELIVTNTLGGVSDPCYATLTANPEAGLWIEMYWAHSGDDMDLHLLAPGGTVESDMDCHYENCVGGFLDWGTGGYSADDPSLDFDDVDWTGPENIRIEEPQDGEFTVIVHDYPNSVYSGSNQVWVKVYVGGELAFSDDCGISGEDSYTTFAYVEFPAGTVTDGPACD